MKHVRQLLLLGSFLTFHALGTFAQTVASDFDRVRATYRSLKGIYAELEYVVFQGHDGTRAVDVKTGVFKSDMTSSFLFEIAGNRQCHNPAYDIVVSQEEKTIFVQKRKDTPVQTGPLPGIDTSGGAWKTAVKVGEGNGIRTWRISFRSMPGSEFEKMDISIDTQTFLIRSVSLYYRAKMASYLYSSDPADEYYPKMTITYKNVRINPAFGPEEFSEKKYIRTEGTDIKPTNVYANYEILIQNP